MKYHLKDKGLRFFIYGSTRPDQLQAHIPHPITDQYVWDCELDMCGSYLTIIACLFIRRHVELSQ